MTHFIKYIVPPFIYPESILCDAHGWFAVGIIGYIRNADSTACTMRLVLSET